MGPTSWRPGVGRSCVMVMGSGFHFILPGDMGLCAGYPSPFSSAVLIRWRALSGSLASGEFSSGPRRSGFSRAARRSKRTWRAKPEQRRHIIKCMRTSSRRRRERSQSIDSETSLEISRQRSIARAIPISRDAISCTPPGSDGLGGAEPIDLTRKSPIPYRFPRSRDLRVRGG